MKFYPNVYIVDLALKTQVAGILEVGRRFVVLDAVGFFHRSDASFESDADHTSIHPGKIKSAAEVGLFIKSPHAFVLSQVGECIHATQCGTGFYDPIVVVILVIMKIVLGGCG